MTDVAPSNLFDRTVRQARSAWQRIAGGEYDAEAASLRPDLPGDDADKIHKQMQECLDSRGGEVSARAKAAALGRVYLALNEAGRRNFLQVLGHNFDVNHDTISTCAQELTLCHDDTARPEVEDRLRKLLEAPRIKLLTQFNGLPEGVKFLVDLRADLLPLTKSDTVLAGLDKDLKELLNRWFDVGFLELRRITWDNASAALLEKLIAYEAVHAINDWDDLKNRLDSDRRCFAFFHPRMPEEPLIFVEVALVNGLAGNVQGLLDPDAPVQDPQSVDTAIFYSISNAQRGLSGISFGNFLIKRVVECLSLEFPGIKTYATLSPVPGFRAWLDRAIASGEKQLISASERRALNVLGENGRGAKGALKNALNDPHWHENPETVAALKSPLMGLCARYLTLEKRHKTAALDPVAHFHLSNGARIESLNWMGDRSEKGYVQSAGIMINYLYKMDHIEVNHEKYTSEGTVAISSSIRGLL